MRLISWNVNGLRAAIGKGFYSFYKNANADIFCIQETKMQEEQLDEDMKKIGNYQYFNSAEKKGYSGTAIFSKEKPISVYYGFNGALRNNLIEESIEYEKISNNKIESKLNNKNLMSNNSDEDYIDDKEGRIITLEYEKFYMVNCYIPNSKRELERLDYRMNWEDNIRKYLMKLDSKKPVIYCGDLNVAHKEIDLKNPSTNHNNAGFTDNERNKMTNLLDSGFVDTFRYKYPDTENEYSWWSYMFHAREKNVGWRIDYFIVSDRIKENIIDSKIHQEILGSDHCPIELEIEL